MPPDSGADQAWLYRSANQKEEESQITSYFSDTTLDIAGLTWPHVSLNTPVPVIRKYSAARRLVLRNTHGVDHPARRSRARQHPRASDVGIWN
jgi:hypothetical protein